MRHFVSKFDEICRNFAAEIDLQLTNGWRQP